MTPKVGASQAWQTALAEWGDNVGGSATLSLGILNTDTGIVKDRLTWLITFSDVVVEPGGPVLPGRSSRAPTPYCHAQRVVAIDANSGETAFVHESGGHA